MKKLSYVLFILMSVVFFTSCNKDDDPVEVPQTNLPPDYVVLKALSDANAGNSLNWDFDDTSMKSWSGVTLSGERVITLDVSSSSLKTLPSKIGELSELTSFKANDNDIATIPAEIRQWKKLTYFATNENAITNIPKEIGELVNLIELHLMGNQLSELPLELEALINVVVFDASYNALTT